jgi:hypothetical protein
MREVHQIHDTGRKVSAHTMPCPTLPFALGISGAAEQILNLPTAEYSGPALGES